jgi:hypothetical protein
MKTLYLTVLLFVLLFTRAEAQNIPKPILFKNGQFVAHKNLQHEKLDGVSFRSFHYQKKYYALIQFDKTPEVEQRKQLAQNGVTLFDYVPHNAFMAEIQENYSLDDLQTFNVSGLYTVDKKYKISANLVQRFRQTGQNPDMMAMTIAVCFYGTVSKADIISELRQKGARILQTKIQPKQVVFINASLLSLQKIADLPFVTYISEQELKDSPLNYNNHAAYSIDALNSTAGRNLRGTNVTVGVGDDADPSSHIDFAGRLYVRTPAGFNVHGTHTTGTTAGGGILNPMYAGMAPMATIVSQYFSDILVNAPTYINDFGMVLTNNSYYSGNAGCAGEGEYDPLANYVDYQLDQYDSLMHVFAAGNDGGSNCTPYTGSFATIKSGFQCAKNAMTIGADYNTTHLIAPFSSCGPVNDGRIKPEVVAGGVNIYSTFPDDSYWTDNGTSMSAPTVTGTLALLYQRYRQLNSGKNPSGALIKAVVCNSADDEGNPGPDFQYGFGKLNARTAIETIENNQYFTGTINNGSFTNITIPNVPAGAYQVKIMLYWPDAPAAPYVATTLVNNLDLTVTTPDAMLHHPLILDPSPANVNNNAVEGIDTTNNIEQVVVNNPAGGNFTVTVNGTNVPTGSQNFVIAYQIIKPSVTVEYPFGSEMWVPGTTENIRWSAYGGAGNSFTLEYSLDNGATWNTINNNIPDGTYSYAWTVPSSASNQALIRVTRNGVGYSDISDYDFTILGQPTLSVTDSCQGYAGLLWNSIPSASQYEIMELKGDSMQTIATSTDTSFLVQGLNRNSSYWFSVRADYNGSPGRRAVAVNVIPSGNSTCTLNNDFTVDTLFAPTSGRMYTSTQLSNASVITMELRNLGGTASSGTFPVSYQVNGGSVVTETVSSTIAPHSAINYSFATPYDFSVVGTYNLRIWVSYPADTLHANDTLDAVIKNLQNDTLSLNPSFVEGFESAAIATYTAPTMGFIGLDRCDFSASNANGRARTFINTGIARTGNRSAILDQIQYSSSSTADSLITTFNLSNYTPGDQIWLNFYVRNQGIDFSLPNNQVWIRGNDQSAWIPVFTLPTDASSFGVYESSPNIDVSGTLGNASPAQTISSSFQIKFGEQGYTSSNSVITDGDLDNGYSFDDITFTRATNDVGMNALIAPVLTDICNLSNAEQIQVKVKNYSASTLTNIPVSYSINGGTPVTESIPSIAGKDSIIYTFTQTADLSAYQNYNLNLWVAYPGDTYHSNDSLLNINFNTTPIINTFPYLEGFESNNGYWYTGGINSSWQWGAPQKTIINKAANGVNAWVTSLTGDYNNNELSYLYSPCFDLSSLSQPVLSFSHIFQTEDDCDCDYHWVEYSTNDSVWLRLGVVSNGTNWYDDATNETWQKSYTKWHVSSYDVPTTATKVRFRIVMSSDPATTYEGVGIDDVHVFDKAPVYSGANLDAGITQSVSGNNWINFSVGSNQVAAINPNGQNLGNTTVKVFINTTGIRHTYSQYYLDRNIVVQPTNQPTDSVSVRFYFLDSEADSLINAGGCPTCTTISDAYECGVTQYSNDVPHEDSTLNNDSLGTFRFILPRQQINIIPNDNGYYAEYKVAGFSEFWINNGGPTNNQALPISIETFSASLVNNNQGLLKWTVAPQSGIIEFVVQKSSDGITFTDIGTVEASPTATVYQFIDDNLLSGENYYRLRIPDSDGNMQYSPIRNILWDQNGFSIFIFPNPVKTGLLYINTSVNCNSIQICDVSGRVIKSIITSGLQNSVSLGDLSKGIYLAIVITDSGKKVEKIVVE